MAKKSRGKRRLDKFYNLAKEQGYRSRAAFKLIQLDRKYGFLAKATAVLDLCAAPGGWCQVARKAVPVTGMVIGIDLEKIKPIRGVTTLVEDITTESCRAAIRRETREGLVDVVLHDGAPNVGGNWASEAYTQSSLVLDSLRLATEFLVPNGTFVTKVFRSSEYTHLLFAMNQLFRKVEATKPQASRNTSAEIFVVCLGYKAPGKIDPRLLDHRHLFRDVTDGQPAAVDVLRPSKRKAPREGYEEGASLVYKEFHALDFVRSDKPVEMLGAASNFQFGAYESEDAEGEEDVAATATMARGVRDHVGTTSEILELCADLKVLGKREFKELLKWRMQVRKSLMGPEEGPEEGPEAPQGEDDSLGEEQILSKMSEIRDYLERRERQAQKRRKKQKHKLRRDAAVRARTFGSGIVGKIDGAGAVNDDNDEGLFSLASITRQRDVDSAMDAEVDNIPSDASDEDAADGDDGDGSEDSDEEKERYEDFMEEYLEKLYDFYQDQRKKRERDAMGKVLRKKNIESFHGSLERDALQAEEEEAVAAARRLARQDDRASLSSDDDEDDDDEDDEDDDDREDNALVVRFDRKEEEEEEEEEMSRRASWFEQDLFKQVSMDAAPSSKATALSDDSEDEDPDAGGKQEGRRENGKKRANGRDVPTSGKRQRTSAGGGTSAGGAEARGDLDEGEGFEIVKADSGDGDGDGSGTDSDADSLDTQDKAETLAYAKKLFSKKGRSEILDNAYNKWNFHDKDLPRWFEADDARSMRPIAPVTKEEVEEFKAQFRAVDARSTKKVMEAKMRKKRKQIKRLEAAKARANVIAGQDDLSGGRKMREIAKLMAKARNPEAAKFKEGGGKSSSKKKNDGKTRGPPKDRRMLADTRGEKMRAIKMKKSGKKKKNAAAGARKGRGGPSARGGGGRR